jgi:uncharacterized BrkB/YihY/UPF0761 family membrane protein
MHKPPAAWIMQCSTTGGWLTSLPVLLLLLQYNAIIDKVGAELVMAVHGLWWLHRAACSARDGNSQQPAMHQHSMILAHCTCTGCSQL